MRRNGASVLAPMFEHWRSMYDSCGLPSCRNTVFMRSIQSRVGITAGQHWYCGVDCFVAAMRNRYSALSATKVLDIRHVPRRPIGLLLLAKDFLTQEQLRAATEESERRGERLDETLTRMGIVSGQQIATARAAQWGCPVYGQDQPVREVDAAIPRVLLTACSGVPLHYSPASKRLVIGFFDRVDYSFLSSLEEITGVRPEACFISTGRFADQLARLTAPSDWEEIAIQEECTPAQMANTTGRHAIDAGVRDARSTRCHDFIWTRLTGKRRVVDLLYRAGQRRPARLPELPDDGLALAGPLTIP